jgi:hypothetical protein
VPGQELFPVRPQLRVIGPRFGYGSRLGFLCPLGDNPFAHPTNLLDGSGFRFMGARALRHQTIDHIGDLDQSLPQVGLVRVAFVQALKRWFEFSRKQFIVHEPL